MNDDDGNICGLAKSSTNDATPQRQNVPHNRTKKSANVLVFGFILFFREMNELHYGSN